MFEFIFFYLSIIFRFWITQENQTKTILNDSQIDSIDKNNNNSNTVTSFTFNSEAFVSEESTVNEINPVKPIILHLPSETIYKGIVRLSLFSSTIWL